MAPTPTDPEETSSYQPQLEAAVQPAVTAELPPPRDTGVGARSAARGVAVVERTGPSLTSQTNTLRQSRLRAAALFLSVTAVAFLVFGLIIGDPLWPMHAAVAFALGAACALLSRRTPISALRLRVLEFTIFGLAAVHIVVMHYYWMLHWAEEESAMGLLSIVKNGLIIAIILMFAYAMLIPNPWRVAAGVVLVLALVPIVTGWVFFRTHPETARLAGQEGIFARADAVNLLLILIAAGLSVYGTHVLNTLRQEVHEARRLNQYRLREPLGAGGMGEVYLAEHRLLKRLCAMKLIRPESAGDRTALARFEREVRSAARLSHPNIVEIYDYGYTEDGTFYYVMEYLRGLTLAELVERDGPLPAGRAVYLLAQACSALAEAHAAGLVHRDLKPANIFAAHIGRRYDVTKLLDFGLVKEAGSGAVELTAPGVISGTPLYMAPEQALASGTLDHRADLYALGGVAYYLLTGRPPFEGGSAFAVMMAHARDPVPPPSRYRPELPEDLEQVVLRCLAKDPAGRYPDAEVLRQALAGCAAADEWDAQRAALWWQEANREVKTSIET